VSAEVFWLVAAGVLAVGEMLTLALFLGMFAVGALAAGGVALAGGGSLAQLVAFVGISGVLAATLGPVARRHRNRAPAIATGVDALVGVRGTVVEPIGPDVGQVKIKGEVWSARSFPDGQPLAVGTMVRVLRIEGAIAVVTGSDF
jgi:membrane protein implicated in regulation of membrane protease activity